MAKIMVAKRQGRYALGRGHLGLPSVSRDG